MSNVLQILTNNYSGETAFIIVDTTFGERIVYEDVVLPYNITDDVYEGNYEVYIPSYNLSYKFIYPEGPQPVVSEKCYCYKFTNTSLTKKRTSISLVNCQGVTEKLTLNGGSSVFKCVNSNQYTIDSFVKIEPVSTCLDGTSCPPTVKDNDCVCYKITGNEYAPYGSYTYIDCNTKQIVTQDFVYSLDTWYFQAIRGSVGTKNISTKPIPIVPNTGTTTIGEIEVPNIECGGPCDNNLVVNSNFSLKLEGWSLEDFDGNPLTPEKSWQYSSEIMNGSANYVGGINGACLVQNCFVEGIDYYVSFDVQMIQIPLCDGDVYLVVYAGNNYTNKITKPGQSRFATTIKCQGGTKLKIYAYSDCGDKINPISITNVCVKSLIGGGGCGCYQVTNLTNDPYTQTIFPCNGQGYPLIIQPFGVYTISVIAGSQPASGPIYNVVTLSSDLPCSSLCQNNLVTNGDFSTGFSNWTLVNGGSLSVLPLTAIISPGFVQALSNQDFPYLSQDIGMIVGSTYRVTFDFIRNGETVTGTNISGWRVSLGTTEILVQPTTQAQFCEVEGICAGNSTITFTALNFSQGTGRPCIKNICVQLLPPPVCECYKITKIIDQTNTVIVWYQFQSCDGVMRISSIGSFEDPNPTYDTVEVYISAIQNTLQICAECYSDINQYNQVLAASTITLSSDEELCNQSICENNLVQNWDFSNGFNNWTQTPQNSWALTPNTLNPYEQLSISFDYYGFWDSFIFIPNDYENVSISQDIGMQVGSNYRVSFYAFTAWPSCININVYLGTNVLQYSNNSNVLLQTIVLEGICLDNGTLRIESLGIPNNFECDFYLTNVCVELLPPPPCLPPCFILLSTGGNETIYYFDIESSQFSPVIFPILDSYLGFLDIAICSDCQPSLDATISNTVIFVIPNNEISTPTIVVAYSNVVNADDTTCPSDYGDSQIITQSPTTVPPFQPAIAGQPLFLRGLCYDRFDTINNRFVITSQMGWDPESAGASIVSVATMANAGVTTPLFNLFKRTITGDIMKVQCNGFDTIYVTTNDFPLVTEYWFEQWTDFADGNGYQQVREFQLPFRTDGMFIYDGEIYLSRYGAPEANDGEFNGIYSLNLTGPWDNIINNLILETFGPDLPASGWFTGADSRFNDNNVCFPDACFPPPPTCTCYYVVFQHPSLVGALLNYTDCYGQDYQVNLSQGLDYYITALYISVVDPTLEGFFTIQVSTSELCTQFCEDNNLVLNPNFTDGTNNWNFDGWLLIDVTQQVAPGFMRCISPSDNYLQQDVGMTPGLQYLLTFDTWHPNTFNNPNNCRVRVFFGTAFQDVPLQSNVALQSHSIQFTCQGNGILKFIGFNTQCRLYIDNICLTEICPTPSPFLEGCQIFLNERNTTNIWLFTFPVGGQTLLNLPNNNVPNDTYRDITVTYNPDTGAGRIYVLRNANFQGYTGVINNLKYWDFNFATGECIDNPQFITLPNNPLLGQGGFGEGLSSSVDGDKIYYSQHGWQTGSNPNLQSIISYDINTGVATPIIYLEPGARVAGDIVRSQNRIWLLVISVASPNWQISIRQYTCTDDTLANTSLDIEVDLFTLSTDNTSQFPIEMFISNGVMYIIRHSGAAPNTVATVFTLNPCNQLVNPVSYPNIGVIRGSATYASCNDFTLSDPRCKPLFVFANFPQIQNNAVNPPNITITNYQFLPATADPIVPLPAAPAVVDYSSALQRLDITHFINFNTNTGRLWVMHYHNATQGTVIDQYNLIFNPTNCTYSTSYMRRIRFQDPAYRVGQGLAAASLTRLITSRVVPNNSTTPNWIIELNISSGANPLILTNTQITDMFPLPVAGSVIQTTNFDDINIPQNTTSGSLFINNNVIVSGDLILNENNKLIVNAKWNQNLNVNTNRLILQYLYIQNPLHQPEFARLYTAADNFNNFSLNTFLYGGEIWMARQISNNNTGGFSVVNLNVLTAGFNGTDLAGVLPPGCRGPRGASSPKAFNSTNPCGDGEFIPNVIPSPPCLPICFVLLSVGTGPFYYYDIVTGNYAIINIPGLIGARDIGLAPSEIYYIPSSSTNVIRVWGWSYSDLCFPDNNIYSNNISISVNLSNGLCRDITSVTNTRVLASTIIPNSNNTASIISVNVGNFTPGDGTFTTLFTLQSGKRVTGDIAHFYCYTSFPTVILTTTQVQQGQPSTFWFEIWTDWGLGYVQTNQFQTQFSFNGIFVVDDTIYLTRNGSNNTGGIYTIDFNTGALAQIDTFPANLNFTGAAARFDDSLFSVQNCIPNICTGTPPPPNCVCTTFTTGDYTPETRILQFLNCDYEIELYNEFDFPLNNYTYGPYCVSSIYPVYIQNFESVNTIGVCFPNNADCVPPPPPCYCMELFTKFGTDNDLNESTLEFIDCEDQTVVLGPEFFPNNLTWYGPWCIQQIVNSGTTNFNDVLTLNECIGGKDCLPPPPPPQCYEIKYDGIGPGFVSYLNSIGAPINFGPTTELFYWICAIPGSLQLINYDITASGGICLENGDCAPTPTPTPTMTQTPTMTPTITPTNTSTPTPTKVYRCITYTYYGPLEDIGAGGATFNIPNVGLQVWNPSFVGDSATFCAQLMNIGLYTNIFIGQICTSSNDCVPPPPPQCYRMQYIGSGQQGSITYTDSSGITQGTGPTTQLFYSICAIPGTLQLTNYGVIETGGFCLNNGDCTVSPTPTPTNTPTPSGNVCRCVKVKKKAQSQSCNLYWVGCDGVEYLSGTTQLPNEIFYLCVQNNSIQLNGICQSNSVEIAQGGICNTNNDCIPTPTPTRTPTKTPSSTPTNTPSVTATNTPSVTPSNTSSVTPTNTRTQTPTNTRTQTPTNTPSVTPTNTPSVTPSNTQTPSNTATNTPSVTQTPSNTITNTPSNTTTNTPSVTATNTPTNTPSVTPTNTPTPTSPETSQSPTPTNTPTQTNTPSNTATNTPSNTATNTPSVTPTNTPTNTTTPTNTPTPSTSPPDVSQSPTSTNTPSVTPTNTPSVTATNTPSVTPTNTPSVTATNTPSNTATNTPSITPTNTPSNTATNTPSVTATNTPSVTATNTPSNTATNTPSVTATNTPSNTATNTPSVTATNTPTVTPTNTPTVTPTNTPSPSFPGCPPSPEDMCYQGQGFNYCYCYQVTNISGSLINVNYDTCESSSIPQSISLPPGDTTNVCSKNGITNSGTTGASMSIVKGCTCCFDFECGV